MKLRPFPEDIPNKGLYRTWSSSWTSLGYSDSPQYLGQTSINFPEDATPFECFIGGYVERE